MPKDDVKETVSPTEPDRAAASSSKGKDDFQKIDADSIVKPYIDRITKEQAQKNDYKTKYEDAMKEIEQLRGKDSKSAKEITEEDETLKKQNADLNAQIKRSNDIKEVNGIFKKADLNIGDDVLNMVVNNDATVTVSNAKAIIDLVNKSREEGRNSILQGQTPKVGGNKLKTPQDDLKRALGL